MKNILIAVVIILTLPVSFLAQTTEEPSQENVKDESSVEKKDTATTEEKTTDNVISESEDVTEEETDEAPAAAESATTGTLIITTAPDSALVVFDGAAKGKSPVTIEDISPGKHTIVLKKKGHFAKKATVNVKAGAENELKFELVKPVTLSIDSDPSGASILVNTKETGKTPYSDSRLKPGTYNILLAMEGYKKEQHTVTLGSGERDSMFVTLMPVSKVAEDTVSVKEEKAAKKDKSRISSILDKVALGVFIGFSLIILLIELNQK